MTPSVFIGIPSNGSWQAEFGMALAGLMTTLTRPLKGGAVMEHVRLWNTKGSILPRSRTTLVQNALKSGCSHILFLDSDMVFPTSTLHRLLQWDKAVVACNCPVKTLPSNPTARLLPTYEHPAGVPVYTLPDSVGLQKVWRVGTGVMLIKLSVFDKLEQPWFPVEWNPALNDYTGEDWSFCAALERAGIPIHIDAGLSREIGHVGDFRYEHSHVEVHNG